MIVAGSSIFKAADPKAVVTCLRNSILRHGNGMLNNNPLTA
jgi:hypothetical protein